MICIYGQFFCEIKLPSSSNTTETTILTIKQMLILLNVLVSVLMSPRRSKTKDIDRYVKIFLSCCHRFVRSYYTADALPFWANTGNFPSLLDIPDQIAYMGPLRWYWELSNERFIQTVKKVLKSMRRTLGYFQKMGLIQKLNVIMWISKRMDLDKIVDMRETNKMCAGTRVGKRLRT